jgi:hypothetical protein
MFQKFKEGYETLQAKRQLEFDELNISNQVYVFDVPKFLESNQQLIEIYD